MIWHYEILFQRRFKVLENICETSRVYPKYYRMETCEFPCSLHHKYVPKFKANFSYCILRHNSILLCTLKHLSSLTFKEIFVSSVHSMMISRIINRKTKLCINFWPPELCKILISLSWFYLVIFPLSFKKKKKKTYNKRGWFMKHGDIMFYRIYFKTVTGETQRPDSELLILNCWGF